MFKDFRYRMCKSWSCERRVVGKAEYLAKGVDPRFIATSIASRERRAYALRGFLLRAGDMEQRIKEQQLALFADRTSTAWMRSNQLRLYFSSFAYILMQTLGDWDFKEPSWPKRKAKRYGSSCSRSALRSK